MRNCLYFIFIIYTVEKVTATGPVGPQFTPVVHNTSYHLSSGASFGFETGGAISNRYIYFQNGLLGS